MKIISLIISLFIFTFVSNIFAQTESAKPRLASPRKAEAEMDKLKQFVGEFSSSSKLYNGKTGELISQDTGTIICRLRSLGYVFTIEKESVKPAGSKYDDVMAFQYDSVEHKMKAALYSPDVKARQIDVEIKGNIMTLIYEPYLNGEVTRETVTAENDGVVRWLIEHKQDDGSYRKSREITTVRQSLSVTEGKK